MIIEKKKKCSPHSVHALRRSGILQLTTVRSLFSIVITSLLEFIKLLTQKSLNTILNSTVHLHTYSELHVLFQKV